MNLGDQSRCAVLNIASQEATAYSSRAKDSEEELLSQGEDDMNRGYRHFFNFFVLTAALAAPTAISAAAKPQDNGRQEEHRRDANRFYDRDHRDYHNWDDNEDRSYRQYLQENHRAYRRFAGMNRRRQRAYWNWRHSHPDHDHDGR